MYELNDIYANVEDLSGKRRSISKSSESVYENVMINTLKPSRSGPSPSGVGDVKKSSFRAVAVLLGLLSFFLLTGLITSVCLFTKGISQREMEIILLQTSYTNLTKERDNLLKGVQHLGNELNICLTKIQTNALSNQRRAYNGVFHGRVRRDGNGWMGRR